MYQLWAITSSQLDSSLALWIYCKAEYFRSLHLYITHSLISAMYWPFNSLFSSALIANTSLLLCFNKVFLYTFVSVSAVCPLVADLSLCLWQCRQRPSYRLSTLRVLFGFTLVTSTLDTLSVTTLERLLRLRRPLTALVDTRRVFRPNFHERG